MEEVCLNKKPGGRPMHRRGVVRVAVVALVVLTVLGGGGWLLASGFVGGGDASVASSRTPQWDEVRFEAIPITVVAEGELVAKDQVDINNIVQHNSDPRIETVIEEGTWVEEGDWLCTLSAPGLVSDRDELDSRVLQQAADVEEAKRNLDIERDTAASDEAKARLTLELAQLAYKEWEKGTHPQRVRDLDLAKKKAERELKQAKRELAFSKELFEQEFISRTELEQDEIRLIEAENAMETAKLDIRVYHEYEKVKSQKELKSDITQAEEELERTLRKNENRLKLLAAKVKSESNELDRVRLRLADFQRMVDGMVLTAPRSGMVVYGSTVGSGWEKRSTIRQGARVWGGRRVLVISDTTQMVANIRVHESRIGEVEPGQTVAVQINARPGLVVNGKVIAKRNAADSPSGSGNPHLSQYLVQVELPAIPDEDLRPGMNCSAEIFIREIPDALAVPIQSVHTEGEEHFVYVEADRGKVRKQAIEIGGASDTLVQIKGGLEAGTRVLLRSPRPGELLREESSAEPVPASDKPIETAGSA